jgi:hypothetical protein
LTLKKRMIFKLLHLLIVIVERLHNILLIIHILLYAICLLLIQSIMIERSVY